VLSVDVPYQITTLYAAIVDASDNLTVTSFPASQASTETFDFTSATTGKAVTSALQTYTYLFEENYPEPGDYDYNDVVLRVSQQRTAVNQITVTVTLSAVGAAKQIAGCIRLVGYSYDTVDSVYTTTGVTFNDGINDQTLYPFGDIFSDKTVAHSLLMKGRNQEAVLNLFCDAHWAMAFNLDADYGLFTRKKYNVIDPNSDSYNTDIYQTRATRTLSYVVTFKNDDYTISRLDNFTLNDIDPFIITYYNGGNWETHVEQFKSAKVLANYSVASFKDLPWALMVPTGDFRYPLEGNEMGYRKRVESGAVAMIGAYTTTGHSFGEWAEDHTRFLDWYLYLTNASMVY
jgi:LruC domain-containing protein